MIGPPGSGAGPRSTSGRLSVATAAYAAAAIALTWPTSVELGRAFPGMPGDQTYNAWCMHHFWWRVLRGESPFVTDRVLYPVGANLMHAITAPVAALPALPFYLSGTLVLYFGIVALVSVVVGGLGMRACALKLGADPWGALLGGLLYAASPTVLSFTQSSHHFKTVGTALLPWGLAALLGFLQRPERPRTILGLSLAAWALLFTDYYVWLMFVLLVLVVGLFCARRRHVPAIAMAAALNAALALAVLLALPPLDPSGLLIGGAGLWSHANINLRDLFVPGAANPILGSLTRYASDRPNGDVDCYYLGFGAIMLAAIGLRAAARRQRGAPAYGLVAGGLLLAFLACGTAVRFGGRTLLTGPWTAWYWMVALPPLRVLDLPRCFVLGLQTAVAASAALGVTDLLLSPARKRIALLIGALIAIEYASTGMDTYAVPIPQVVTRLATLPDRTLLELPSGVTESKRVYGYDYSSPSNSWQMYYQTIHHKRRVGAYLSRIPTSTYVAFEHEPVLGDILAMTGRADTDFSNYRAAPALASLPDYPSEVVSRFIERLDLGYVVIQPNPRHGVFRESIERVLGPWIAWREESDGFTLYALR